MKQSKRSQYEEYNRKTNEIIQEMKRDELNLELEYEGGIDEAGRGPVLGPMVYSLLAWPIKYKDKLQALGFNDSKQLTEDDREVMYENLNRLKDNKVLYYIVVEISAETLSNQMLRKEKYNLNAISHDTAMDMIQNTLNKGIPLQHVYVDTVGNSMAYQQKLFHRFEGHPTQFTVTEKADSKYMVVGAASICAKVSRDRTILRHQLDYQDQLGCGYPGDAKTIKWIGEHCDSVFGLPNHLVRYSWKTIDNLLETKRDTNKAIHIDFVNKQDIMHSFKAKDKPELISKLKITHNFNI